MSDASVMLLKTNLTRLRLPTISAEFQALAREAAAANEGYDRYLLRLTELSGTKCSRRISKSRRFAVAGRPAMPAGDSRGEPSSSRI